MFGSYILKLRQVMIGELLVIGVLAILRIVL